MQIGHAPRTRFPAPTGTHSGTPESSREKHNASLFIDSFYKAEAHGFQVEKASRSVGDNGPSYQFCQVQLGGGTLPHLTALKAFEKRFSAVSLPLPEANASLDNFISSAAVGYMDHIGGILEQVTALGYDHSVLNASLGFDEFTLFQLLGSPMRTSSKSAEQYRENLDACLESTRRPSDPQLPHPKMQRDQLLFKRIARTLRNSETVKDATARWRHRVENFEAQHNSVVLASGNSGKFLEQLSKIGFQFDGGEDFNLLAVPEVTTVGASSGLAGNQVLHPSSSFGPEVDILADGSHGGTFGTSYAAPKVANTMRAVHARFPSLRSDEVEEYVKQNLSNPSGPMTIWDGHEASAFLVLPARQWCRRERDT